MASPHHPRRPTSARPRASRTALAAVLASVAALLLAATATTSPATAQTTPFDVITPLHGTSVFVPITPQRLFVGELPMSFESPYTPLPLAEHVPVGATAVALSLTSVANSADLVWFTGAFAQVCGAMSRQPYICATSAGAYANAIAASSSALVGLGADRVLRLGASVSGQMAVDLLGYFVPATGSQAAGRFKAITPVRALDTRDAGAMVDAASRRVDLSAHLPADAGSAVVTLTAVDAERAGHLVAHAAGTTPPPTSNLLVLPPLRTASAQAIVPLHNGAIDILHTGRSHLLVDVVGYFTSATSPPGDDGLFVPTYTAGLFNEALSPGTEVEVAFTPPVFGPAIGALALQLTAFLEQPGFLTAWSGGTRPWTTSLFVDAPAGVRSGATITATSGNHFRLVASSAGYADASVNGYFTG